ncbi:MAG: hypothetical protein HY821_23175 [Acidobacteria bacterium]|nr:hypothetical protein [Acidobacteriota bacterium]
MPVLLLCSTALAAQTWNVRLVKSVPKTAQALDGDAAKLKIEGDMLVCDSRGERKWQAPLAAIRDLSHATRVRNRGALALEENSSSSRASGDVGELGVLLLAAALSGSKAKWEYVTIGWRENQAYHSKLVRLRQVDLPSFQRELKARTWLEVADAEQELKDLWREIDRRRSEALSIRLEKQTLIRKTPVRAGPYLMIILEKENSTGRLYLFRGNRIDPTKPALEIPITITANNEPAQGGVPIYAIDQGWKILQGIRLGGSTVRIVE